MLGVDDSRDAADSAARLVETMGHEVRTAFDGLGCARDSRMRAFVPDAVRVDTGLRDMSGYEVAARRRRLVHERAQRLQKVAASESQANVFDHLLFKPVDFNAPFSLRSSIALHTASVRSPSRHRTCHCRVTKVPGAAR